MKLRQAILIGALAAVLPFAPAEAKKAKVPHAPAVPKLAPSHIPLLPPILTTYDVYVGGFHLISTRVWFEEQNNSYHVVVKGGTYGF